MNIREFAFNLQKIYEEMSETFSSYQQASKLPCLPQCGRCCTNPEIEASPLEMVPFALKVYDEGKMDEWIHRIEQTDQLTCLLLLPGTEAGLGKCLSYKERPSLCRMFGVAGTFDKHNEVTSSICKYIKEEYPENIHLASNPPLIPAWMTRLSSLHPELLQKTSINKAMLVALQQIALYAQYQDI